MPRKKPPEPDFCKPRRGRRRKMPKGYVSHTQVLTFVTCPLSYRLKYIDGIIPITSYPMKRGSVMHTALKELNDLAAAEALLAKGNEQVNQFAYEDVQRIFKKAVRAEMAPGELTAIDTQEMMVALIRKAEEIYATTKTFVGAEVEVQVELLPGLGILVVLDRIDTWGDNGAKLDDYKYALPILRKDILRAEPQLLIYAYVYSIIHPNIERFLLTQDMLRYKVGTRSLKNSFEITSDDVVHIRQYLESAVEGIESGNFEPRINDYCHSCLHRVKCPAYKEYYVVNKEAIEEVEVAHAEWMKLSIQKSLIEVRRKQIRAFMADLVNRKGKIPVEGGLREWWYWETYGKDRDAKKTIKLFYDAGLDITPLLSVPDDVYNTSRNQLFTRLPQRKIDLFKQAEKELTKPKITTRLAPRKKK